MVINFKVVLKGRLQVPETVTRQYIEARIRSGLCLSLPLHEAIDELLIETDTFEDMVEKFS